MPSTIALYSAVGDELTHFDLDVEAATLSKRATITVPAGVSTWPHPSHRFLYARRAIVARG
jgi:hypothetical protein